MSQNAMYVLCTKEEGSTEVLQGNIAFAAGCVRAGIHSADGYPGTPSTEVIDKGLSQVQDLITVGWSVNEAVALGVGVGHTFAGEDCVVTMKIPGLYQAADIFTSYSQFTAERGALILYIASDFTPSSTQHVIDPHYLYKSSFVPVFEPRNHQEMLEAASIAVEIGRKYNTLVVIHSHGLLCHSEGLVRLNPIVKRDRVEIETLRGLLTLPNVAKANYDKVILDRLPALTEMVENSPLHKTIKGNGKKGVITYSAPSMLVEEYKAVSGDDIDILELAFTNPLPMKKIKEFCDSIDGDVYIIEDGYHYLEEECRAAGLTVKAKPYDKPNTEWTPATINAFLTQTPLEAKPASLSLPRPPMICSGCPYRATAQVINKMKKQGDIHTVFGDIGCNTLLYFLNAVDTGLAMGASESMRTGYVLSRPEEAHRCFSLLGDGTECHSGLDSTRNAIFRKAAGVKIVLDNQWVAMTGGQPSPSSPQNLAGDVTSFNLEAVLKAEGAEVLRVNAYERKDVYEALQKSLELAKDGKFVVVLICGTCVRKLPASDWGTKPTVDLDKCKRCKQCATVCAGIELDDDNTPKWNNLCNGCVMQNPVCLQNCKFDAISIDRDVKADDKSSSAPKLADAPESLTLEAVENAPERLSLGIRGVGGQGNLFFGKALSQMAFLAGYAKGNIVKGETHGMAQMGGPVISTFGCGKVYSPIIAPKKAMCLIAMEQSEIFRDNFLDLLDPNGTLILAEAKVQPQGINLPYPSDEDINKALEPYNVIRVNVLDIALSLGDPRGKCANVVMLGVLSKLAPFNSIPKSIWLQAIKNLSKNKAIWDLNYAAFNAGYEL